MILNEASANRGSPGFFICIITAALLVVTTAPAHSQVQRVIKNVKFHGLTVFSPEEISSAFATKPEQRLEPTTLKSDMDNLLARYREDGYYYTRIDSVRIDSTEGPIEIALYLSEGRQARVDTIVFEGDSALTSSQLLNAVSLRPGSAFVQADIEEGAQQILHMYENAGYPFARISIDDVAMSLADSVYLVRFKYVIEEGKQIRIKELRVEGNTTTRYSVIAREARLGGNDFYSEHLAQTVKRRLDRLQLFSSVSQPQLFVDQQEEGGLLVKVQEGNPNRFDGIVGYVPSPRTGTSGYLTGMVDLQFRNLFGTSRRLAARWSREDQSTQELGLQYFEPWIASYPVNGQIGFLQRIQDSTYVRRVMNLDLEFLLNDQLSLGGVFSRTNVIPSQSYGRTVLAESQGTSVGLTVSYDTRNDPVTPRSGIYYTTEYDLGVKDAYASSLFAASSSSTQRVLLDLDYYIEPIRDQVIAETFHLRDFRSNDIALGDLFRLGGASTLRGYREGQFLGSRLVWSNLEYRFLVAQRSYFYGFFDAGYIVTPNQPLVGILGAEQTKYGYGVGVRMDSNLGLIGVGIGFGEGDTFSTAKLHIQMINAF